MRTPEHSDFVPKDEPLAPWHQRHGKSLLGIAALIGLLLFVVLVLPQYIPSEKQSATSNLGQSTANSDVPLPPNQQVESPWQQAQLAKARKDAQGILAQLLETQTQLENKQIHQWANDAYQKALTIAEQADNDYRQRRFQIAQQQYQQALEAMRALLQQASVVHDEQQQLGQQALDQKQPDQAQTALQLANAIQPNNATTQQLLKRAKALPRVIEALRLGDIAEKTGQLTQAKTHYKSALKHDADSLEAQQSLQRLINTETQKRYSTHMSNGFKHLQQKQFKQALQAFNHAKTIKPNSQEVADAISQARTQQRQQRVEQALLAGQTAAEQEQWQKAVTSYQQALNIDNTLVAAKIGHIKAKARLTLDKNINAILSQPARLRDDTVYQRAQQLQQQAQALESKQPRLQAQITQLSTHLKAARTPVNVTLVSDNQTHVSVYHVGELGHFERHTLNLYPGKYTAVGQRDGFKDKRVNFVVKSQQPLSPIRIECNSPIAQNLTSQRGS